MGCRPLRPIRSTARCQRSEEHTSELQSQSNLVCRLLLEKKKSPLNHAQLDFFTDTFANFLKHAVSHFILINLSPTHGILSSTLYPFRLGNDDNIKSTDNH